MPYLDLTLSGPIDAELAARAARELTALTDRVLGKDPALTAVAVRFVDADAWFIGGESLAMRGARSHHLSISITDETNTKREKAAYLAEVHRAMDVLLGGTHEKSYVHVIDARAAAYGYGGRTQEWRSVQATG